MPYISATMVAHSDEQDVNNVSKERRTKVCEVLGKCVTTPQWLAPQTLYQRYTVIKVRGPFVQTLY